MIAIYEITQYLVITVVKNKSTHWCCTNITTIDEEHIISKTCGPDLFQESLNVAFKEYKTIKSKYVLLQEDMSPTYNIDVFTK